MSQDNRVFDIVPGRAIGEILSESRTETLDVVRGAYAVHDAGRTVCPDSYFLRFPNDALSRIIALPAAILDGDVGAGVKWISSFPRNIEHGVARASAVLILNDLDDGYPIACLEGAEISAARTAASVALVKQVLDRTSGPARSMSFIGAGVIACTILEYLLGADCLAEAVQVYDVDSGSRDHLVAFARRKGVCAQALDHLDDALDADVFVTATTVSVPYIHTALRPGQVAFNVSLRDFDPHVVLGSDNYLDDVDHCLKQNTSPHLAEQVSGGRTFVTGVIPELLDGRKAFWGERSSIVSPFGLGVLDLALGKFVLDRAKESGRTVPIDGFFGGGQRWSTEQAQ